MSFLTVCLNPTLQKTLSFPSIISGTVNRTSEHCLNVSGKGVNVTRVLTQLGKKAVHLTQLGGSLRPLFLSLCEQDDLSVEWVESNSQIRFCYTMLTANDNNVTELVEESEQVGIETEKLIIEKFNALITGSHSINDCRLLSNNCKPATCSLLPVTCLIISGTKAEGFSDKVFPEMVKKAKEKGLRVLLDIRGNDLSECLKYEPDIIKPNLFEFVSTFAPELIKDNDFSADHTLIEKKIKPITLDIIQKYKCRIILTNGSKKLFAAEEDRFFTIEIDPVKTVNSIGCGDAFTAGLAAGLETMAFRAAINEGIRCGGLNAGLVKPGVIR